jgi:hypothetical protein
MLRKISAAVIAVSLMTTTLSVIAGVAYGLWWQGQWLVNKTFGYDGSCGDGCAGLCYYVFPVLAVIVEGVVIAVVLAIIINWLWPWFKDTYGGVLKWLEKRAERRLEKRRAKVEAKLKKQKERAKSEPYAVRNMMCCKHGIAQWRPCQECAEEFAQGKNGGLV